MVDGRAEIIGIGRSVRYALISEGPPATSGVEVRLERPQGEERIQQSKGKHSNIEDGTRL